ncbi:unnamed protein product [Blumeria hordei]|uniref:Ubiquitin-like modifier-activating enzyme ATG7 n=1 Tax=Blumeria hordei TaxID=2867405 RepID=A0A383UX32_BLUHO|nr:unnamed protein product [Blumeria hordei]
MASQTADPELALKFAPFGSEIELPFYRALSQLKIDVDRLDDSPRPVLGLYQHRMTISSDVSCRMQILGDALTSEVVPAGHIRAEGKIKNLNTFEDFKNVDKASIMNTAAKQIWDAINDGSIYTVPSLLSSFTIISYADLKNYKFTYWFAFPALHSRPVWNRNATEKPIQLTGLETSALHEKYSLWKSSTDVREHGFFLAKKVRDSSRGSDTSMNTIETISDQLGYRWEVGSLRNFENGFFHNIDEKDQYISFVDPSTYPDHPGWMLRNFLVLIRRRFRLNKVQILCYRDTNSRRRETRSLVLNLETESSSFEPEKMPVATGWGRNSSGKVAPMVVNLSQYLDPKILADSAVELNTKLIKWRAAPSLNLDIMKNSRCLLLGAGTLGTYVSRLLLGWNVNKITFIDNANVSFSNPVRQPLFSFEDCLDGGTKKAIAGAAALRKIFPGVESSGHVMTVPMLGHPFVDELESRSHFELMEKLFDEHDVIFLLMDTRESRWLPTVMGKAKNKLVLNAALGFDTWMVMRHGMLAKEDGSNSLGCYFCNDVVVPTDSVKDQTLDQQCTVTRPGIAPMAAAQIVELLVSILQHPLGPYAPCPILSNSQNSSNTSYDRDPPDHPLGIIPHQIRGFCATFQNMIISGKSYDCCSACSPKIINEYEKHGWEFVKRALSDETYVSNVSGLAEVQRLAELALENTDWSETEDVYDPENEGELL